jgi:agmatine deiminase
MDGIHFLRWPTNRGWIRDSGPIFVRQKSANGRLVIINWNFNAWAKYRNWREDNKLTGRIAGELALQQVKPMHYGSESRWIVLEGGSIGLRYSLHDTAAAQGVIAKLGHRGV